MAEPTAVYIAEVIWFEDNPVDKLCKHGHAARRMVAALLADNPEEHPPTSPILDALVPVIEAWAAQNLTGPASSATVGTPETGPGREIPGDLRDQLRDAIRQAPENDDPPNGLSRSVHPATDGDYELISGPPGDFADAVLPVVEAETAALRKRAEEAEADAKSAWQNAEDWHEAAQAKERRAEEAERQRDTAREALNAAAIVITSLRDQRDEQRQRTENAEMEGRNILRRLDIADRLAGALEDERDKARRERDEERVIRQQAEEIIAIAHDTSNQAERARQAAERALAQARDAIADERRGRLAAEAAARRGREIHRRHDCGRHVNPRTPVPCANHGLCEGCGAPWPCRTFTALDAEQPKETPPAEHVRGANAEDCPACSGRRDLPYPFICPGTAPAPAAPDTDTEDPVQCRTCESYILPDGIGWRHALGPADHTPEPAPDAEETR